MTGIPARPVLLVVAHPHLAGSRVNRALVEAARGRDDVTVHDLARARSGGRFDVAAEQRLLSAHGTYVFLHPLYWFAAPALLKAWQDEVLVEGFAHGREGDALAGRRALVAVTAGGRADDFSPQGRHGASLRAFLLPFERTLAYCGVEVLPPFAVFGGSRLDDACLTRTVDAFRALLDRLADGGGAGLPEAGAAGHLGPDDLLGAVP
ncbi:MAG: NAD(P)H-dependent oxidoreductase [Acidobacteriota bacterium]